VRAEIDRRRFLQTGALAAAAAALPAPAFAHPPAQSPPRYKLSLAAYSMRKYLDLKNPTMTLEQFIEKCAEWGLEGTELTEYYFRKPVSAEYVMKLKRLAIRHALDITCTPIGNSFTHPPGEARDKQVASVKNWIDVSADLGSAAIRIFAGGTPKGTDESTARKWAIESIEACLPHAEKRGVFLALENHGGVVATAEGMLEFAKAIKNDWFGFNLDGGNFHSEDPYAELQACAPYAVTCQVKAEISRKGKKEEADYKRIIGILREARYRGYVTLEYESAEEPLGAIPRHLEALRKVCG
jgi:sugar phosphate isomerase/epimerase